MGRYKNVVPNFQLAAFKKLVKTWMYLMWLIWNNKNHCFHKLSCRTLAGIVRTIVRMKDDFLQISCSNESTNQRSSARWMPLGQDSVKLNVDATYYAEMKVASRGMVIQNDLGAVCLCVIIKTDKVESSLQAELKAIAFDLEIAKENLFPSILVESDSLLAIQEILKHQESFY